MRNYHRMDFPKTRLEEQYAGQEEVLAEKTEKLDHLTAGKGMKHLIRQSMETYSPSLNGR